MPHRLCYPHCLKLIDFIDFCRSYTFVVSKDCTLNKSGSVMCFKAPDNSLIVGLDVGSEVWLEVFDSNSLEIRWYDVTRKVTLK